MTNTFDAGQVGRITASINLAIGKATRVSPMVKAGSDDIRQSAWIKVLVSYDSKRDEMCSKVRATRKDLAGKQGLKSDQSGWTHAEHGNCPEAFAFTVAYREAMDYLRNAKGKHRADKASLDAPTSSDDDNDQTMVDIMPSHTPSALDMLMSGEIQTQVERALPQLSPTLRSVVSTVLADDRALTGAERISKMRAIDEIQGSVSHRYMVR